MNRSYAGRGNLSDYKFDKLVEQTGIRSPNQIAMMRKYFVTGYSIDRIANLFETSKSNLTRDTLKVKKVALWYEQLKEHDLQNFNLVPKSK